MLKQKSQEQRKERIQHLSPRREDPLDRTVGEERSSETLNLRREKNRVSITPQMVSDIFAEKGVGQE